MRASASLSSVAESSAIFVDRRMHGGRMALVISPAVHGARRAARRSYGLA